MKKVMAVVFALAVLTVVGSSTVGAQTPFIAVYFDETVTEEARVYPGSCPPSGTIDTLYVAGVNFNAWMGGFEYSIDYGNNVAWLADLNTPEVTLGTSPVGISLAYAAPENGFNAVLTQLALIQWTCVGCQFLNDPITVLPNGATLFLGGTTHPAFGPVTQIPALGLTALTCPTIATEETTWGQVKALYGE